MKSMQLTNSDDRNVAINDLAREFGSDPRKFRRWLLRHDFSVERRHNEIAVLTHSEAAKARFLNSHGVLFEEVTR